MWLDGLARGLYGCAMGGFWFWFKIRILDWWHGSVNSFVFDLVIGYFIIDLLHVIYDSEYV